MKETKHTKRTKRTNLVLDPDQLEEARRILGTKTYSETVTKALAETIRVSWVQKILDLAGKVKWEGDLAEMREDNPRRLPARKRVRR
jgi:Arc/MetJ family transcription regulator